MIPRREYKLPEDKERLLQRARRLEWLMLAWQATVVTVMFLAMGSSQAMKTAWVDDSLALVPPVVFLIALRIRGRPPNEKYPYGYRRAPLLSFLAAAVAILVLGLYILGDSVMSLLSGNHPTIGHFDLFGWQVWAGWVMIAALTYSALPSLVLGPKKHALAMELHEKTLNADATMNKDDWMTSATAAAGVLGIGLGLWWFDSAAAILISLSVIKDGVENLNGAMQDLMDSRPTHTGSGKPLALDQRIRERMCRYPGVEDASVRLREAGHIITGEIFVQLKDQDALARQLREMTEAADELDWRLYNLTIMPVENARRK